MVAERRLLGAKIGQPAEGPVRAQVSPGVNGLRRVASAPRPGRRGGSPWIRLAC